MGAAAAPAMPASRPRWSWLWSARDDVLFNLLPFWLGLAAAAILYGAHAWTASGDAAWTVTISGHVIVLGAVFLYLYGPLVDAPHLWATIARTYTDRDEWKARRTLFLASLAWLAVGPVVILLPYVLGRFVSLPSAIESSGWLAFSYFLTFYALFHINRQHWGFVALYRRKNGEAPDAERSVDAWFFQAAMWLPFAAMIVAPWYRDLDGKPYPLFQQALGSSTLGAVLLTTLQFTMLLVCAAYALFQFAQRRRGVPRDGPKLVYMATVVSLYFVTFALTPVLAALWVPLIGVGHCAQYHRVVWSYGQARYVKKAAAERRAPTVIFERVWLYALLGVLFGVVTLQGPGAQAIGRFAARVLDAGLFSQVFALAGAGAGLALGAKVFAAMVSGVRLHHFYVDSKIWKVSQSAALAKNLNV